MEEIATDLVTATFEDGGHLSKRINNYKVRPQQVELANKIQSCIKKKKPLMAEAPTGVGKSLASLVPAFEHIMETDETVIVVTSSIILQEQYMNKDIPMLEELYGFKVKPVLIKGRNNFVCPKKVAEAKAGKVGFSTSEQVKQFAEVLDWATTSKRGDKAELDFVPSYNVWAGISCVDGADCKGKQCPLYNACPYYRERNRMGTAKLIVCNYHYFFNALRSENMLPPIGVVIMDEGHEINAIARDFQEQTYSTNSLQKPIDRLSKEMKAAEFSDVGESVYDLIDSEAIANLNTTLIQMFAGLKDRYHRVIRPNSGRSFWEVHPATRSNIFEYAEDHVKALDDAAAECKAYLDKFGFDPEAIFDLLEQYDEGSVDWLMGVHFFRTTLLEFSNMLHHFFNQVEIEDDGIERLYWVQQYRDSVQLHIKPTTGQGLTKHLFYKSAGLNQPVPIIMSATLTTNKSFDHLKEDLGVGPDNQSPSLQKIEELSVTSPFNLDENLLWYLPPDAPAGNDRNHLPFVLKEMEKVVRAYDGRTLCLFTSNRNMDEAEKYFEQVLPKHIQIISQNHMPKQRIIDFMKKNSNTVVIGTRSFFTGVDIQGPNLSAVLLDKFPFPIAGDPIVDYLSAQPRGFHKHSLPEAIIAMKQAFGRLNRTSEDKGVVAIYDGRLSTARYKNKILNSFTFKIQATKDWNRVEDYIAQTLKGEK
ncbi:ATP-dependent DNA helicase [Priestia megaterium]